LLGNQRRIGSMTKQLTQAQINQLRVFLADYGLKIANAK
jgi:hypothetical protein